MPLCLDTTQEYYHYYSKKVASVFQKVCVCLRFQPHFGTLFSFFFLSRQLYGTAVRSFCVCVSLLQSIDQYYN